MAEKCVGSTIAVSSQRDDTAMALSMQCTQYRGRPINKYDLPGPWDPASPVMIKTRSGVHFVFCSA